MPFWLDEAAGIGVYLAWLIDPPQAAPTEHGWLWCSAMAQPVTWPAQAWPTALGPFLGGGMGWHFSRGVLGKGPAIPLSIFTAVTHRVARFFGDLALYTLHHYPADLTVLYQPCIDEMAHQVMHAALDDWPYGEAARALVAVHEAVDHQLGRVLDLLTPDDTLVLSSDHGHEPIRRCLRPNVLLHQAGLLAIVGDKIDPTRTRAAFHSSGWIVINTTSRRDGMVTPAAYEATLQAVERCLDAALDPQTGQSLGLQHSRSLWCGQAPIPGDMFIWGPPETELRSHLFGSVCDLPEVSGHHQTSLHPSPYLQAVLALRGPALAEIPLPTRNAEVADLIRRALGLPGKIH
jgi:hypothetical protein